MTDQLDTIPGTNGSAQLFAKMARVMGKMSRIKKTGTHPTQHYPFATDADVSDLVREALAEEGIAFLPSMTGVNPVKIGETKYQSPIFRNYASFVFTFACADTGATYSMTWQSEADDSSDKGINKTATAAVKYFLLKTFLISTGDSVDPDASADVEHAKPKAANKPTNGNHAPPPAERPTVPPSQNGAHGSDGKTIDFPGKPATPKNAAPAPVVKGDTKIEALKGVIAEEYIGKGNKKAVRFVTGTGSYSYTRQPFRDAGLDTEQWTKAGNSYTFDGPFNVISVWHQPEDPKAQGYWKIDRLELSTAAESTEMA